LANQGEGKRLAPQPLYLRLGEVFAQFKPQAVFLPGWCCVGSLMGQHWCNVNGVPSVVMSESNGWDEKRVAFKEWVKRRVSSMYSAALVGGTTHKAYLVELGMAPESVFFGYDAVDNDHFASNADDATRHDSELRKRYRLPDHFFLASARFVEKKNLWRLIDAYANYRKRALMAAHPDPRGAWDFVLLGDGPLCAALQAQISALNLEDHVLLPGFKSYAELPIYYGLAHAFVHASITEQWGLVVNEAMASGLPVLVSNRCGCAAELVTSGRNGFTFDAQDGEQLTQLMLKIASMDPMERMRLSQGGREIISRWGPERYAQGVSSAAARAMAVGPWRASWLDTALLRLMAASSV
jgi:glycosyltransferase involved in cell wall biosynthesis